MITAAGCIIYRRSKGFLLLKKKNFWEFPKGRTDADDKNALATALRETKEETGLAIKIIDGFHEQEHYRINSGDKIVDYWIATTNGNPVISSEHLGYAWCSEEEVLQLLSFETKKVIFKKAVAFLAKKKLL